MSPKLLWVSNTVPSASLSASSERLLIILSLRGAKINSYSCVRESEALKLDPVLPGLKGSGVELGFSTDWPQFPVSSCILKIKSGHCLILPGKEICVSDVCLCGDRVWGAEPLRSWALGSDLGWSFSPSLWSRKQASFFGVVDLFLFLGNSVFLAWFINCWILISTHIEIWVHIFIYLTIHIFIVSWMLHAF